MNATEYGMAHVRIQWEAIDALRELNRPEPKSADVVSIKQAREQLRRKRCLAMHARPFPKQPNPPSAA